MDEYSFCYRLNLCRGRLKNDPTPKKKNVIATLVADFVKELPTTVGPYIAVMDNYYASLETARYVTRRQITY